ncbi:oncoprotein-induced transcript 3 protein-like [Glandiceps talaboti]
MDRDNTEPNQHTHACDGFLCDSGKCIRIFKVCDGGTDDCGYHDTGDIDTSDEDSCQADIIPTTKEPAEIIQCDTNQMSVVITKNKLMDALDLTDVDPTDFHLEEESCIGSMSGDMLVFATMLYSCGTTSLVLTNSNNISYTNMVYSKRGTEVIEMTCVYPLQYDLEAIHIITNPCDILIHYMGFGTYNTSATLYTDATFTATLEPATDFPVEICDGTLIYFGITVDNDEAFLEMLVKNCFISMSNDPGNPLPKYDYITDGCLVPDYVFEYDVSPTNELEKHYGIDVYDLANGDNITVDQDIDLYLHCSVVLCRINDVGTPCDLGCTNSPQRKALLDKVDGSTQTLVTHGPFTSTPGKGCDN